MVYEHISNISPQLSDSIKKSTNQLDWDQQPLDKNMMSRSNSGIAQSWEITKQDERGFHDILLDDHMVVYRFHPNGEEEENKYKRMMQWENEIRVQELQKESIDKILKNIDGIANEQRDQLYLAHKLLRETQYEDRRDKIISYIDEIS